MGLAGPSIAEPRRQSCRGLDATLADAAAAPVRDAAVFEAGIRGKPCILAGSALYAALLYCRVQGADIPHESNAMNTPQRFLATPIHDPHS